MGKRNNGVVVVLNNLTKDEASILRQDAITAKQNYAPGGKGRALIGKNTDVGRMLQKENRWLLGGGAK